MQECRYHADDRQNCTRDSRLRRFQRADPPRKPGYKRRYNRIAWNTFTVNDWRRRRFDNDYPEYVVEVLRPDGKIATGNTGLAKLRALYDRESKEIG